jgi:hypothetical protein
MEEKLPDDLVLNFQPAVEGVLSPLPSYLKTGMETNETNET